MCSERGVDAEQPRRVVQGGKGDQSLHLGPDLGGDDRWVAETRAAVDDSVAHGDESVEVVTVVADPP